MNTQNSFNSPKKVIERENLRNEGIALAQQQKQRLVESGQILITEKKSFSVVKHNPQDTKGGTN